MKILILMYILIGVIAGYLSLNLVNDTVYDNLLKMISFISALLWPVSLLVMVLYSK